MLKTPRSELMPRSTRSLRQEYEEFILLRIEEYKEQLSRGDLLRLGDEAVRELESGMDEQHVLTEVLMLDHVDRLIRRQLNLPTFRRWRDRHVRLRKAQQAPTHWGLPSHPPLSTLARRCEAHDVALVIGARWAPAGFLLAAHEVSVVLVDGDIVGIEAAETRAASEVLTRHFQALVLDLSGWLPDVTPTLLVADVGLVHGLGPTAAESVWHTLAARTPPHGVHIALSDDPAATARDHLAAWRESYASWEVGEIRVSDRISWIMATKPAAP